MPARRLSPVLLLGGGTGEATCGILYLAGYLRRHGVEAWVKLHDPDHDPRALKAELTRLMKHAKPKLVGISLKWFHHVSRALQIARLLKQIDPEVQVALGGNTATYFCKELIAQPGVDFVIQGDGEVPLLALARGDFAPPNVVGRAAKKPVPMSYIQSPASADVYYSHFDEIFLSQLDAHSFSGWVQPGKGCGENCVYCGGTRGMQKASFGRAKPFLRPELSVLKDHQEIAPRTWQLRYDFAGSSGAFLERAWAGVDLSRHSVTYFMWGKPAADLVETLARTFERVFMVLDIGCFSQSQRLGLMQRGLLKPCPTDAELMAIIEACRRYPNLELEISGIAGLPFASQTTLQEETRLFEHVLGLGCTVGYQRLESQPGALVTEHPDRFGMRSEATSFEQFKAYFDEREGDGTVPMLRFADPALEDAVQTVSLQLDALMRQGMAQRAAVEVSGKTRLVNKAAATLSYPLGEWIGGYRAPAKVAGEPVTVVRSISGIGLACAPGLSPRKFSDPTLEQGESGQALLDVLEAFERPTRVDTALARLKGKLEPSAAREVIDHLANGLFLQPQG